MVLVPWLIVGGVFAVPNGPWAPPGPQVLVVLVGGGAVLRVAFAVSRPVPHLDAAKPIAGWR